jgi:hypothetical protein
MIRHFTFLIAAIIVSPILGAFLGYTIGDFSLLLIMDLMSWVHNFPTLVVSNLSTAIFGTAFSIPIVLVYGVPVYYLLGKMKLQNVWMFGLFGLLPTTIGTLLSWSRGGHTFELLYMTSVFRWAMAGCLTACFFWLIAVYLPSRSNKNYRNPEE